MSVRRKLLFEETPIVSRTTKPYRQFPRICGSTHIKKTFTKIKKLQIFPAGRNSRRSEDEESWSLDTCHNSEDPSTGAEDEELWSLDTCHNSEDPSTDIETETDYDTELEDDVFEDGDKEACAGMQDSVLKTPEKSRDTCTGIQNSVPESPELSRNSSDVHNFASATPKNSRNADNSCSIGPISISKYLGLNDWKSPKIPAIEFPINVKRRIIDGMVSFIKSWPLNSSPTECQETPAELPCEALVDRNDANNEKCGTEAFEKYMQGDSGTDPGEDLKSFGQVCAESPFNEPRIDPIIHLPAGTSASNSKLNEDNAEKISGKSKRLKSKKTHAADMESSSNKKLSKKKSKKRPKSPRLTQEEVERMIREYKEELKTLPICCLARRK